MERTPGERLDLARRRRRLSQQQLADQLGVSRSLVSMWITNTRQINIKYMPEIIRALKVSGTWIMEGRSYATLVPYTEEEEELLGCWRDINSADRATLLNVARALRKARQSES